MMAFVYFSSHQMGKYFFQPLTSFTFCHLLCAHLYLHASILVWLIMDPAINTFPLLHLIIHMFGCCLYAIVQHYFLLSIILLVQDSEV